MFTLLFLRYDPKKTIKVYVGVNNKHIDKIEPYKHDVKEVITHDNWDGSRYTYPDLALIKLAKKVKFYTERYGRDSVVPVCLSNKNIQKDIFDSEAFVAGRLQSSQKISVLISFFDSFYKYISLCPLGVQKCYIPHLKGLNSGN